MDRADPSFTSLTYWQLAGLTRALRAVLTRHPPAGLRPTPGADGRARCLDYGCGDAPYRPLLEPLVAEYVAADLPGNPAAQLSFAPGGALPVADASFELVVSFQVLEHVERPAFYLAECRRVLTPGGLLILSTHGAWWYHGHPEDYQRWTRFGLRRLLAAGGFEILDEHPIVGPLAYARLLRGKMIHRVLRRVPLLGALFAVWNNAGMWGDELLTPAAWREHDASTYLYALRPAPGGQ